MAPKDDRVEQADERPAADEGPDDPLRRLILALGLALPGLVAGRSVNAALTPVTLFAAASTYPVIEDLAAHPEVGAAAGLRGVYAASSTLARQIVAGAPADLFLSANRQWMDYLITQRRVDGTAEVVAGNRLVLVAAPGGPLDDATIGELSETFPLAERLGRERLALGDPAHVPVGIYAKQALSSLGLWAQTAGKAAFANDARALLALVERGNAAGAIVYSSDLGGLRDARPVAEIPARSHAPIVYSLAAIAGRTHPARDRVFGLLTGETGRRAFVRHGFSAPSL